ncbi:MAG TPA: cytochrome c peroxidase [Steroidobacteraceae bacterium]
MPEGTELNEDSLPKPREIFRSETSGKSYMVNLGDLAFSSPAILGNVARRAGVSCSTCHVNGASNAVLYVPGMSSHPGNFDTTGAFFNPKANDHTLDPLTIPSLRGARFLAPYGHDGRFASLHDFVRNVIVNEFAGPEPSAAIVDAIVAYIQDIDFLPNPRVTSTGRLAAGASASARRGEALFSKPFRHDPELSCAACHVPSAAFVDHRQHDVGSGGLFKTPTLVNADFSAPYFHDGRFTTYDEVVRYFDRQFDLRLTAANREDLVTYLMAVGDGERAQEPDSIAAWLKEIGDFSSVLATAIPARDGGIVALAVDTVGTELRELTDHFPDRKDTSVSGGSAERLQARMALKELVLSLRRVELACANQDFETAIAEYREYNRGLTQELLPSLQRAEPWSLFDPAVHEAHYAAMRRVAEAAKRTSP